MSDQNENPNEILHELKDPERSVKLTFLSKGEVSLEVQGAIGAFELWSGSRFMSLKGDELYINAMTAERMKQAAQGPQLVKPPQGMKIRN